MKKNVWIMNHYAGGMFFDQGGRHYNFAKYLKRSGYEPVVFCANSRHNAEGYYFEDTSFWHEHMAKEIAVPFVFVKTRSYSGNGKQRVLNMVDFYRNVKKAAKEYAKQHGKPDVIYASSVHPLTLVAGIQLAKKFGVKCISEVRDLWPESIVAYSERFTDKHPLIKMLYQGEKWIYKKSDGVIMTGERGYEYIKEKGWEKGIPEGKVYYVNNGVDLETFCYNREHYRIQDEDLENPDIFKVIYTGSIRKANSLGMVLDIAKELRDPKIKILIWGSGDEYEGLCRRVEEEQISNVVFKGRVEKKYIPYIVSKADLNYAHNMPGKLFRFGISLNKMFDYLAAGKPVIADFPCGYNPIVQTGAGTAIESAEKTAVAREMERYTNLPYEEYQKYCQCAITAAEEYDFANLSQKLIRILEGNPSN